MAYEKLAEWTEHALAQGDGTALYQEAAKEALSLLADAKTWDTTAAWLLKKLEEAEADSGGRPWPAVNPHLVHGNPLYVGDI